MEFFASTERYDPGNHEPEPQLDALIGSFVKRIAAYPDGCCANSYEDYVSLPFMMEEERLDVTFTFRFGETKPRVAKIQCFYDNISSPYCSLENAIEWVRKHVGEEWIKSA